MIEAAIHVVAESGLRGLTYRAVAQRAGVNNSLVAHHFGSRDGLIEAALEYATSLTLEAFEESADLSRPLARDLVSRLIGSDTALQTFQYELLLESRRTPSLRPLLVRQYDAYLDAWQAMLPRFGADGSDRALARAVAAAIDGLVLQQMHTATPDDIEASTERLRAMLRAPD